MRSAALALIASLAAASPAFAQDPPPMGGPPAPAAAPAKPDDKPAPKPAAPAKHENKITEAAKAVFESMGKAVHDPVAAGLKEIQGNLVLRMEFEGMDEQQKEQMEAMGEMKIDFAVDFKAPNTLKVEGKTENPMLEMQMPQMKSFVEMFFLYASGRFEPKADGEYDADVVTEEGKKFLVVKSYEKNVAGSTMKLGIDASGLPGKGALTATDPMAGVEQTVDVEFRFTKDGERHRFDRFIIHQPGLEEPIEFAASYTDAGGFKVLSAVVASVKTPKGEMKMGFRYESLTVNGKKIELPKPEKKAEPKKAEEKAGEKPAAPPAGDGEKKPEPPKDGPK